MQKKSQRSQTRWGDCIITKISLSRFDTRIYNHKAASKDSPIMAYSDEPLIICTSFENDELEIYKR